jgi:hypothetical protein
MNYSELFYSLFRFFSNAIIFIVLFFVGKSGNKIGKPQYPLKYFLSALGVIAFLSIMTGYNTGTSYETEEYLYGYGEREVVEEVTEQDKIQSSIDIFIKLFIPFSIGFYVYIVKEKDEKKKLNKNE